MERRPDPEPLETNDVALVAAGTVAWLVALVVLLVLKATGSDVHTWWITMCLAGTVLGLIGVRTCQRRHVAIARGREAG
jgi:fatty acid desaturase